MDSLTVIDQELRSNGGFPYRRIHTLDPNQSFDLSVYRLVKLRCCICLVVSSLACLTRLATLFRLLGCIVVPSPNFESVPQ
jgi:hypothetical protein